MSSTSKIDVGVCSQMVSDSLQNCKMTGNAASTTAKPDWDAMASSFAALSAAFTWGTIFLGLVAIIAGVAWANYVKVVAEREAREAARQCAQEVIERWLSDQGPQIIREHVEFLHRVTVGDETASAAADEMGAQA